MSEREAVTTTTKPMSKREPISNEELEWALAVFAPGGTMGKAVRELLTAREELTALRANLKTVTDRGKKLSDERRASADALDDAQREIARLKQEITEDAKATAESQEITGKYMADAEAAQRLLRETATVLFEAISAATSEENMAGMVLTAAEKIRASLGEKATTGPQASALDDCKRKIERLRNMTTNPVDHDYLSTACFHDLHDRCRQRCKFCGIRCRCICHTAEDAKATAESQEITGKYMADAESAQREIERLRKNHDCAILVLEEAARRLYTKQDAQRVAEWAKAALVGEPPSEALREALKEIELLKRVLAAARCIKHWHDAMRDGSGMVVSAVYVRLLWDAIATYDKATRAATGGQG